jgi:hypothetical protein
MNLLMAERPFFRGGRKEQNILYGGSFYQYLHFGTEQILLIKRMRSSFKLIVGLLFMSNKDKPFHSNLNDSFPDDWQVIGPRPKGFPSALKGRWRKIHRKHIIFGVYKAATYFL